MPRAYKPAVKSADRYEVIAFCEAVGAVIAVLVAPIARGGKPSQKLKMLGVTKGGIKLFEQLMDLNNPDMVAEEVELIQSLNKAFDM